MKINKDKKQKRNSKRGQDEMVGFAMIIVMVAVIFIVILSVYLRKPAEKTMDYEANSFVQALLQYTTTCEEENMVNLTVQELIGKCKEGNPCYYNDLINRESNPCKILNDTIKAVVRASWEAGGNSPVLGYWFNVTISEDGTHEEQFLSIKEGVVTRNYKTGGQDLPPHRNNWEYGIVILDIYT
jgi:hypothetical protein